jgi:hypothetical protein
MFAILGLASTSASRTTPPRPGSLSVSPSHPVVVPENSPVLALRGPEIREVVNTNRLRELATAQGTFPHARPGDPSLSPDANDEHGSPFVQSPLLPT